MKKSIQFFLIIILCSFLVNSAFAQKKQFPRGSYKSVKSDFTLTMTDGTILDCSKFTASGTPPSGGWPAMIFCHGFGGTKEDVISEAEDLASNGYFTICYSMRGQGESTGKTNLISTTEMYDFVAVVNYVKAQSNINTSKVGASGGSQGGTIPFMAACYNPGIIKCIISDVSSPEFATSWIENKSVKMTLLWSLSYDNSIANYTNQVRAYRNWIMGDTPAYWDSIAYYVPLNRDFMNKVAQNTSSVFVSSCWQDKFFNPYGYIKALSLFTTQNYRYYMGTFDAHGADADVDEGDNRDQMTADWMDYWLGGISNGVTDSVKFVYASSSYPRTSTGWTWKRFYSPSWPPAGTTNVNFYFKPGGVLKTSVNTSLPDTVGFMNDIKDTTLTMTTAVNYEFTGSVFNSKFGKTQLVFETGTLFTESKLVGTPMVNIHYKPARDVAQFNLQIYEIKSGTTPVLINRCNYTDRKVTPGVLKQLTFYGTSHSHIFQAGSKIRVVITNLDNIADDPFLRTNPYVLPTLKKGRNIIYMNAANPTYIQLPLIGYTGSTGVNEISSTVPDEFSLGQNYPNPFNPETNIKFGIPANLSGRNVTLKVYDIKGQEIQTLVNENLSAGEYEVKFNGKNISSGVYFYSLTAGSFRETKRFILVK
jgi:predicted acyl esterase